MRITQELPKIVIPKLPLPSYEVHFVQQPAYVPVHLSLFLFSSPHSPQDELFSIGVSHLRQVVRIPFSFSTHKGRKAYLQWYGPINAKDT
jgi:hypothetical protein